MESSRKALVRKARPSDSHALGRLHRATISWGLLSQLGDEVVAGFYRAIIESPAAFCFVAGTDQRLEGFAAGICDWGRVFWRVVWRTWWPLMRVFPVVLRLRLWRRLLETGRYTQSGAEGVRAEYVAFGVREDAPGRLWTGMALIRAGVEEFRRRGVPKVRGVVWTENERAVKFFEAAGFKFVSQVEIHPGEISRVFVIDLASNA